MARSKRRASAATATEVQLAPKLHRRFYEALLLLYILGRNRGDPVDEEEFDFDSELSGLGTDKLRRSFTRSLAYLCDYEKRGRHYHRHCIAINTAGRRVLVRIE